MGDIPLDASQARHTRDALRLEDQTAVEVFDDRGSVATGRLIFRGPNQTIVRVERFDSPPTTGGLKLTIASAIPKGERADWMIEKLSELGVSEFIPLQTERSVVKPQGKNKVERWTRIATESAKQSRRVGVMRIAELASPKRFDRPTSASDGTSRMLYLSTDPGAARFADRLSRPTDAMMLMIGPEGGWSEKEVQLFESSKIDGVGLMRTILRVETASIAAAAVALSLM